MNAEERNPMKMRIWFGLVVAVLLTGCASTQVTGRAVVLDFLSDGKTTRQDVIASLGQPSARFEVEKILTYRLGGKPRNHGLFVVEREAVGAWPSWTRAKYSLVLVFDDAGVLSKHSLVEVN